MATVAREITHSFETNASPAFAGTPGPTSPIGMIHQLVLNRTHRSLPDHTGSPSFASGYAIAVVPAITGNAWDSSLVQTLTNAVGRP